MDIGYTGSTFSRIDDYLLDIQGLNHRKSIANDGYFGHSYRPKW